MESLKKLSYNNVNFQKEMDKIISNVKKLDKKPTLLLHSCCAPCSSYTIEYLRDYFDITVYFYNPYIYPMSEYAKRLGEQRRLLEIFNIPLICGEYDTDSFYSSVKGYESALEGGKRCEICERLRLEKTVLLAKEKGFDYFGTTLTISPLKNAIAINGIGKKLEEEFGVKYLVSDFKKKGGYLRSIELSKEYELYRQNYCGCEFSMNKMPRD